MIEFSKTEIKTLDNIIDIRNKLYGLSLDLKFSMQQATQLAVSVSQILHTLLQHDVIMVPVRVAFTKKNAHYYLHVFMGCTRWASRQFVAMDSFESLVFQLHEDKNEDENKLELEVVSKIIDADFIPNDTFIQEEQERLIQQSSGEMLQEIRKKNTALTQALEDLKTSSSMIQTEKMRALGSMTAGVAHELNNPMMGVLNYVQYAIKHTDEDDRKYRPLMDAEREIKRCQDIVTNLLTFSRMEAEGEEGFSPLKLSMLFTRILKLQSYKLRAVDITVKEDYPKEDEPLIKMKVNKMQQVLLNLITNSIHAMKERDTRELTLSIDVGEERARFSVSDTGSGMDEETLDKIFEPFFTTKQAGQGTGLGLAVSKSIIEEHDGTLTCKSEPGHGTCFMIEIPIKESEG
jgi:signal transduction histidine kinase